MYPPSIVFNASYTFFLKKSPLTSNMFVSEPIWASLLTKNCLTKLPSPILLTSTNCFKADHTFKPFKSFHILFQSLCMSLSLFTVPSSLNKNGYCSFVFWVALSAMTLPIAALAARFDLRIAIDCALADFKSLYKSVISSTVLSLIFANISKPNALFSKRSSFTVKSWFLDCFASAS